VNPRHFATIRRSTVDRLKREEALRVRLARIINDEHLVTLRVAEAMDFRPPRMLSAWLNEDTTVGPSQLDRIDAWLDKWDRAEVETEPLRVDRRKIRSNPKTDDRPAP